jgi:hypothetical protein
MFSFKTLTILAAACSVVTALPSPAAVTEVNKRDASSIQLEARAPVDYGNPLRRRASSLPDALNIASGALGPILGKLGQ